MVQPLPVIETWDAFQRYMNRHSQNAELITVCLVTAGGRQILIQIDLCDSLLIYECMALGKSDNSPKWRLQYAFSFTNSSAFNTYCMVCFLKIVFEPERHLILNQLLFAQMHSHDIWHKILSRFQSIKRALHLSELKATSCSADSKAPLHHKKNKGWVKGGFSYCNHWHGCCVVSRDDVGDSNHRASKSCQ